ncbi:f-box domain-containing protein [Rutstroemia sp. NJR-2017a BBW]|nr:f-box domain-containing protein [Rutstroemia sp. NJR-2017a BBW]
MPGNIFAIKVGGQKITSPITKAFHSSLLQDKFDSKGVEPLNSQNKRTSLEPTDATAPSSSTATMDPKTEAEPKGLQSRFLHLPRECQSEILSHATTQDLIALSLVSKHFRNLAAEHLYRSFHIVFPDDDVPSNESPIDSLAGGLDTFTTSDYNYARYLKEIILETLTGGDKGERMYRHYLYDESCGKFMNTLFLLALRKAKALETFSREVFKELHKITALQHLHLRMQAGKSIYQTPPPLISSSSSPPKTPSPSNIHSPYLPPYPSFINNITAAKTDKNGTNSKKSTYGQKPPTISGFKNLKSLAVLDMDTLDYVSEIKECIENSSTTLTALKLSFSDSLAGKSRKPPPEIPSDVESEAEDEFGQIIPAVSQPAADPYAPSKAIQAMEEKKAQEAVLGKLFGIEQSSPKDKSKPSKTDEDSESKPEEEPHLKMLRELPKLAAKIMANHSAGGDSDETAKEVLAMLEEATQKYINSTNEGSKPTDKEEKGGLKKPEEAEASSSNTNGEKSAEKENNVNEETEAQEQPSLFDESKPAPEKSSNDEDVSSPDDIDIEEPETPDVVTETENADNTSISTTDSEKEAKEGVTKTVLNENPTATPSKPNTNGTSPPSKLTLNTDESTLKTDHISTDTAAAMSAYIRKTRGLTLEALSISLIPVKAATLLKAIDITVLRSLTLLNVGPQIPFWNLVSRENKSTPLPLCNIYTDNVTPPFLACVHRLQKVEELLLLERSLRTRVESTAAKTTVTMEMIRRLVLKKHAGTMRVLMLHNDESQDWDVDVKTAALLCRKAKKLEELAGIFDVTTMHVLHQNLTGLESLRALHAIEFRSEDTCMWVIKEFRKFTMDSIAHDPASKLEYLALEKSVEQLVRKKKGVGAGDGRDAKNGKNGGAGKTADGKNKGKGKKKGKGFVEAVLGAEGTWGLGLGAGMPGDGEWGDLALGLGVDGVGDSASESESEDGEGGAAGSGVWKVESVEGLKFCDVLGVRIFEKDVIYARL